ncbi:peflin [Anaeramoeba flamelloides]|uniref:Peflin n=1 Tax=Anaeramoeba flamelloides TaxID=1746091 RepID=A0AAV7ZFR5_9EUKA|nr:peflin [Anaeramoeba flamelloides]KAJ6235436.1 peflin [Anaeramoeba flamelloides]|eukprot:Anaeramoba_flamelloidesc40744_g1_i4.p1 GENE.c40744_g1_i4~~c40744_g1_i4.p1  ORF type:complete len:229 (-),score=54.27 c40744_g1_i4:133-819(-)
MWNQGYNNGGQYNQNNYQQQLRQQQMLQQQQQQLRQQQMLQQQQQMRQQQMIQQRMMNNQLQIWFKQVDTDNSGLIDATELSKALSHSFEKFDEVTAEKLVRLFDRQKLGGISFQQFVALYKFMKTMQKSFKTIDTDGSGTLEIDELVPALKNAGFGMMTLKTVNILLRQFGDKINGEYCLSYAQFIDLCIHLQQSKNVFSTWSQGGNMVTLNFPLFIGMFSQMKLDK